MINRKKLVLLSTLLLSTSLLGVTFFASENIDNFSITRAEESKVEFDIVPLLADKLDSTPNALAKNITIVNNGVSYTFEVYRVSSNNNKIVFQSGGYIRNVTAFNGFAGVIGYESSDKTPIRLIEGEFDGKNTIHYFNECDEEHIVGYPFSKENFKFLVPNGTKEISKIKLSYKCPTNVNYEFVDTSACKRFEDDNFETINIGNGSFEDPYYIFTLEDYASFAYSVSAGNDYLGKYIELADNLDFTSGDSPGFIQIGSENNAFNGIFNGNGKTLNIDAKYGSNGGLFYDLGLDAEVNEVFIEGRIGVYNSSFNIGVICGMPTGGTISGCFVDVEFYGINSGTETDNDLNDISALGGIVGLADADYYVTIDECYFGGLFNIGSGCNQIGGLVGSFDPCTKMTNCCFAGTINVSKEATDVYSIGGLIGNLYDDYPSESIVDCGLNSPTLNYEHNGDAWGLEYPYYGMEIGSTFGSI